MTNRHSRKYILISTEEGVPDIHLDTTLQRLGEYIGVQPETLSRAIARGTRIIFEGRRYYIDHEL